MIKSCIVQLRMPATQPRDIMHALRFAIYVHNIEFVTRTHNNNRFFGLFLARSCTFGCLSDYQIRWLMKPERRNLLGKSLLDPSVLVVCVASNRPSP